MSACPLVFLCALVRAPVCAGLFVCGVNKRRLYLTVDALSIDKAGIDMGTNKKARTGLAHGLGLFVLFVG